MFVCFIKFGTNWKQRMSTKVLVADSNKSVQLLLEWSQILYYFYLNFLNGCSNHSYLTFSFLTISNQQSEKIIIIKIKKINAKLTATEFQFGQFLAMNRIKPHSEPFHGCILLCTAFIWCLNFTDTTIFIFLPIPRFWIIRFAKIHNIPFSEKI